MDGQYGARTVVMIIPFPTRGRIDLHRADIMVPLGAVFSSYNQQYTARFVARLCGIHAAANSGATGYSGVLQSIRSACSFATRCPNGNPHAARRGRPLVQSLGLFVSEAVAVPDTTGSSQAEVFEGQLALGERQAHIQLLKLSYDRFRAGCPWATAPILKGLL